MEKSHVFTSDELEKRFAHTSGKTLGELDTTGLFEKIRQKNTTKMTGIAGDVVEQSILGYPADSAQRPDILLDGVPTEVKMTGLKRKKSARATKTVNMASLEAKEPLSITTVSPDKIAKEDDFDDSNFWHKLAQLLFVYYFYDADHTVPALDYADFKLIGHFLYHFDAAHKAILQQDWQRVRDFVREVQSEKPLDEKKYAQLSSDINRVLMLVDTAPKWPNSPRFRLKNNVVSSIYYEFCEGKSLEELDQPFKSYGELDLLLDQYTGKYAGKTIAQLKKELDIVQVGTGDDKGVTAKLLLRMFGATSGRLSDVKLFRELGVVAKSFSLKANGMGAEDFKLSALTVASWAQEPDDYYQSELYEYLSQHQFLVAFFQKAKAGSNDDKVFKGFKRLQLPNDFIEEAGKKLWSDTRTKILTGTLRDVTEHNSDGSLRIVKRTGKPSTAPNFLKKADNPLFIRGTGIDSEHKTTVINDIHMYKPDIWISRQTILALAKTGDSALTF